MARLYILTEEHIKNGQRPKTPRQKQRNWRTLCLILSAVIVLEHLVFFYWIK